MRRRASFTISLLGALCAAGAGAAEPEKAKHPAIGNPEAIASGQRLFATGCAGCYTAHAALELYAEAFEAAGALDKLEAFASFHGPDFYGLPRNRERIVLEKGEWTAPERYPYGGTHLVPLRAGEQLGWRLAEAYTHPSP